LAAVPGCLGEDTSSNDYCIKPVPLLTRLTNDLGTDAYGLCEGDW